MNKCLTLETQLRAALTDLVAAENFFNRAEAHQVDVAINNLNLARQKVNILVQEAKLEDMYTKGGMSYEDIKAPKHTASTLWNSFKHGLYRCIRTNNHIDGRSEKH